MLGFLWELSYILSRNNIVQEHDVLHLIRTDIIKKNIYLPLFQFLSIFQTT